MINSFLVPFLFSLLILCVGAVFWGLSYPNAWEREIIRRKMRAWKAAARLEGKSRGKDVKNILSGYIKGGDKTGLTNLLRNGRTKRTLMCRRLNRKVHAPQMWKTAATEVSTAG